MIEYAKEVPLRLYSIKFILEYYNLFRGILEINRETSTILDKFCFVSHLDLIDGHLRIK